MSPKTLVPQAVRVSLIALVFSVGLAATQALAGTTDPVITWGDGNGNLASIVYGTAVGGSLNATATDPNPPYDPVPGTFCYYNSVNYQYNPYPAGIDGNGTTIVPSQVLTANTWTLILDFIPTDTGTWNEIDDTEVNLVVTRRPLTVTGITASDKPYDANRTATLAGLVGAVMHNVYDGDASTTAKLALNTNNAVGAFIDKNVGTSKEVDVSGITVTGTKSPNYSVTQPTTTASITGPRTLAVTATGVSKTYDGNPTATVTLGDNRIAGDQLTFTYSSTFPSKNWGTGLTVNVNNIVVGGADAVNYSANTSTSTTADITKLHITVTAVTAAKAYDGNTSCSTAPSIVPPLASGDISNFIQTFANAGPGVGITLTPSGTVNDGNGGANYVIDALNVNTNGGIGQMPVFVTPPAGLVSGVLRQYYYNGGSSDYLPLTPDLTRYGLVPGTTPSTAATQVVSDCTVVQNGQDPYSQTNHDYWALQFTGYIQVSQNGAYSFGTSSDDASMLYVDGVLATTNNFPQGQGNGQFDDVNRTRTLTLIAGYHKFCAQFHEGTGGWGLIAAYKGPGAVGTAFYNGWISITNGVLWTDPFPTLTSAVRHDDGTETGLQSGGYQIDVVGSNFLTGTGVRFGTQFATNVVIVDSQHLTCNAPTGPVGTVAVNVMNANDAVSTTHTAFTFTGVIPSITNIVNTGFADFTGLCSGGYNVVINGSGLTAGSAVTFGGHAATFVSVNGNSALTVTVPPATVPPGPDLTATVDVTLDNGWGAEGIVHSSFTYIGYLPAAWIDTDVGGPSLAGKASYLPATGTFTVSGSGADFWGNNEQGNICVTAVTGDVTIIARVVSETYNNGAGEYEKAGILIRQNNLTGSPMAFMFVSPVHQIDTAYRDTENGGTGEVTGWGQGGSAPHWLKLVKVGNNYTYYDSADGTGWRNLGTHALGTSFSGTFYAGFFMGSSNNAVLSTAVFDNVSIQTTDNSVMPVISATNNDVVPSTVTITAAAGAVVHYTLDGSVPSSSHGTLYTGTPFVVTSACTVKAVETVNGTDSLPASLILSGLPPPWVDVDIGQPGTAGYASYVGDPPVINGGSLTMDGTLSVTGSGHGEWDAWSEFNYCYIPISGNFTITARVASLEANGSGDWQWGGVHVRQDLRPGSPMVFQDDTISQRCLMGFRDWYQNGTGGNAWGWGSAPPYWVRLVRSGTSFEGYISPDGTNWQDCGGHGVGQMTDPVYVGLGVCSRGTANNAVLNHGKFDHISIVTSGQFVTDAPVISASNGGNVPCTVTLTDELPGATIYYTTDNTVPSSTHYTGSGSSPVTISLNSTTTVKAMAAASGYAASRVVTQEFGLYPWTDVDIGSPTTPGHVTVYAGAGLGGSDQYVITSDGTCFWNQQDEGNFLYQQVNGNCTITARVVSVANGTEWDQGAVLIRQNLDPGAPTILMGDCPNGFLNGYRNNRYDGMNWIGGGVGNSWGYYIRVSRVGNTFSVGRSADGIVWYGWDHALTMSDPVYIGIGTSDMFHNGHTGNVPTFTYDSITTTPAVATPVVSGDNNQTTPSILSITCATPGATIYYTTNGSIPTASSAVYDPQNPPTITTAQTYVQAVGMLSGYENSNIGYSFFDTLRDPEIVGDPSTQGYQSGLFRKFWTNNPWGGTCAPAYDVANLGQPTSTQIDPDPRIPGQGWWGYDTNGQNDRCNYDIPYWPYVWGNGTLGSYPAHDNWTTQFIGYVTVPSDGMYYFPIDSDDDSQMYIGGYEVRQQYLVFQPGNAGHGIALKAGSHKFEIRYAEGGGGWGMNPRMNSANVADHTLGRDTNGNATTTELWTEAAPTIIGLDRAGGPEGGGTLVHITGTGFKFGATVNFGGTYATEPNGDNRAAQITAGALATGVIVNSNSLITCYAPAGTGAAPVYVINSGVNKAVSHTPGTFNYVTWTAPTVTSVDPPTGMPAGGEPVTVYGADFITLPPTLTNSNSAWTVAVSANNVVTVDTIVAHGLSVGAVIGTNAAENWTDNGFMGNLSGMTVLSTTTNTFTFALTQVEQGAVVETNAAAAITITYNGYTTLVNFGSGAATNVVVVDSGMITCNTPSGVGRVNVTVTQVDATNHAASGTAVNAFTFSAVPTINQNGIVPASGLYLGGYGITVTGTNIASNAVLTLGGVAVTNVQVNSNNTILTAVVPQMATLTATVDVVLTNPGVTEVATVTNGFTYTGLRDPDIAGPESPLPTGMIAGVAWRYYRGDSSKNIGYMDAAIPTFAGWMANAGYNNNPFEPSHNDNWGVRITGYFFLPNDGIWSFQTDSDDVSNLFISGVHVGNGPQWTTTYNNVPMKSGWYLFEEDTWQYGGGCWGDFQFRNAAFNGGAMEQIPAAYYCVDPLPTIINLNPNHGPAAGTTSTLITGTDFAGTPQVWIGPNAATGVVNNQNNTISATAQPTTVGLGDVVITNGNATHTTVVVQGGFAFQEPSPTIAGIAPNHGDVTGGNYATIMGTNFRTGLTVKFGNTACTHLQLLNSTTVVVMVPPGGGPGHVDVTVTNGDLTTDTASGIYTYTQIIYPPEATEPGLQWRYYRNFNTGSLAALNPHAPWAAGRSPEWATGFDGFENSGSQDGMGFHRNIVQGWAGHPAGGNGNWVEASGDNWSVNFQGYMSFDRTDNYTFYTEVDDASELWINNTEVVNNPDWGYWRSGNATQLNGNTPYAMNYTIGEGGGGWNLSEIQYSANDSTAWQLNGGAASYGRGLILTDGNNGEGRSAFCNTQVDVASGFSTSFVYQTSQSSPYVFTPNANVLGDQADGFTFTLQNAGNTAVGGGGGGLGYTGIAPSVALATNIYHGNTIGIQFAAEGNLGTYTDTTAAVDPSSGNPIKYDLVYDPAAVRPFTNSNSQWTVAVAGGVVTVNTIVPYGLTAGAVMATNAPENWASPRTLTNSNGQWTVAVAGNTVTVDTIVDHGLPVGANIGTNASWTPSQTLTNTNGQWTVAVAGGLATVDTIVPHGLPVGEVIATNANWTPSQTLTNANSDWTVAVAGGIVTVDTIADHGLAVGEVFGTNTNWASTRTLLTNANSDWTVAVAGGIVTVDTILDHGLADGSVIGTSANWASTRTLLTNVNGDWTVAVAADGTVTVDTILDHGLADGSVIGTTVDWTDNVFMAGLSGITIATPDTHTFTFASAQGLQDPAVVETNVAAAITATDNAFMGGLSGITIATPDTHTFTFALAAADQGATVDTNVAAAITTTDNAFMGGLVSQTVLSIVDTHTFTFALAAADQAATVDTNAAAAITTADNTFMGGLSGITILATTPTTFTFATIQADQPANVEPNTAAAITTTDNTFMGGIVSATVTGTPTTHTFTFALAQADQVANVEPNTAAEITTTDNAFMGDLSGVTILSTPTPTTFTFALAQADHTTTVVSNAAAQITVVGTLTLTMTDQVTNLSFGVTLSGVNLATFVGGGAAYIGFTGGTGGLNSVQTIDSFSFNQTDMFSFYTLPITETYYPTSKFTREVPPTVTGVATADAPPGSANITVAVGTKIWIYGTDFRPGIQVAIGGVWANSVVFLDPTKLTALVPGSTGVGTTVNVVVVKTSGSAGMLADGITYGAGGGSGWPIAGTATYLPDTTGLDNGMGWKYYPNQGNLLNNNRDGNDYGPNQLESLSPDSTGIIYPSTSLHYIPGSLQYPTQPMTYFVNGTDGGNMLSPLGPPTYHGNFFFRNSAYFQVPIAGTYSFQTASDDGTLLYIGDTWVIDNNYWQGVTWRGGSHYFDTPGLYLMTVLFNQGGGGWAETVQVQGPGVNSGGMNYIPDQYLWVPGIPVVLSATHFSVTTSLSGNNATAGQPFDVTVTALLPDETVDPNYTGTVHFTSTDHHTLVILPNNGLDYTFLAGDNGSKTFAVADGLGARLISQGDQEITATDTLDSIIAGTVTVHVTGSGIIHHFAVTFPESGNTVIAGESHDITVEAQDEYDITVRTYTGTISFDSSTDPLRVLPQSDLTFTLGDQGRKTWTAGATLCTAGTGKWISVTDGNTTGQTPDITVIAAPASQLVVDGYPQLITVGATSNVSVTAVDPYGNTDLTCENFVYVDTSADLDGAQYEAAKNLSGGTASFWVMFPMAETGASISAHDTAQIIASGSESGIDVVPVLAVSVASSTFDAGVAGGVTVTAQDVHGDVVTNYTGMIHFTCSDTDPNVQLPPDYQFQLSDNGRNDLFLATLITPDTAAWITATDTNTVHGTITTGTSPSLTVLAGPASEVTVVWAGPNPITAGDPLGLGEVDVYVYDAYHHAATGCEVAFSSTDLAATLPPNYTFAGSSVEYFYYGSLVGWPTLYTAGDQTITATIVGSSPPISGTTDTIIVHGPGVVDPDLSTVGAAPTTVRADGLEQSTITVTLKDQYGNPVEGKTVTLDQGAGSSVINPDPLVGVATDAYGVAQFTVTDTTEEFVTYTATDADDLITINHTATVQFTNQVPLPTVAFDAAASSGSETVASPLINVSLSAPATQQVTVDYAVTGGSAVSGTNYTLPAGTLTFGVGDQTLPIPISIIDDGVCMPDLTVVITLSSPSNATLGATTQYTYTIMDADLAIAGAITKDNNVNGWIDTIHVVASGPLSFSNLVPSAVNVTGYTVTDITGVTGNDYFDVVLTENGQAGGLGDTGNAPAISIATGSGITLQGSSEELIASSFPTADNAPPVLMQAWLTRSLNGTIITGVDEGDTLYVRFSEALTTTPDLAVSDFGLPVSGDSFGAGATIGTTGAASTLVITLGSGPQLSPGGTYPEAPNPTAPGKPTGISVAANAGIGDAASNGALVGVTVDLDPGQATIGIAWIFANGDLSVDARDWVLNPASLSTSYFANDWFNTHNGDLRVLNNGDVVATLYASCSGSTGAGWALAQAAGADQFGMKVVEGADIDLAGATGNGAAISGPLYSGQDQPFNLRLETPTSISSGAGDAQTIVVTITAVQD